MSLKKSPLKMFSVIIFSNILIFGLAISARGLMAAWQAPAATPPTQSILPPVYNETPASPTNITVGIATPRIFETGPIVSDDIGIVAPNNVVGLRAHTQHSWSKLIKIGKSS